MVVARPTRNVRQVNHEENRHEANREERENIEESQDTNSRKTILEQVMRLRRGQEILEIQAIYAQVNSISRQCTEIKREIENLRNTHNDNISKMHTAIRRINFFPTNRRLNDNELQRHTERQTLIMLDNASNALSKCPRILHALWNEYEFGLNG